MSETGMRAILVDDEHPATELISEFLEDFPEVQVVAICSSGTQAVKSINRLKPDLVFLDIQMPGLTGIEVLQALDYIPKVIFTTAHRRYAVEAFDLDAVDYLLKPYDRERFAKAMERVGGREASKQEEALAQQLQAQDRQSRLFVKSGRFIYPVNVDDIFACSADGDYAVMFTKDKEWHCQWSLQQLENMLDPTRFMRIHRSHLVALEAISHMEKDGSGGMIAYLSNGQTLRVGRTYAAALRALSDRGSS